jgi:hypothetical protein
LIEWRVQGNPVSLETASESAGRSINQEIKIPSGLGRGGVLRKKDKMKKNLTLIILYGQLIGNLFAEPNLIQNGSFETGNGSEWNVGSPSEATVSADTTSDGSYALKLESSDGAITVTSQLISVQPNTDYIFTHSENYSTGSTGTVTARLSFEGVTLKISTGSSTDGWETKWTWFNSGAATEVQLDIYADESFNGPTYVDDFALTFLPEHPFRYDIWAAENGVGAADADDDEDGLDNLYEYALAGDPGSALEPLVPLAITTTNQFEYAHQLRNDDLNLVSTVEASTNLVNGVWTNAGIVTVTNGSGGTYDDVTHSISIEAPQAFLRLKVETLTSTVHANNGYYEIVPSGTANDSPLIQAALDRLQDGDTLVLNGDFVIRNTIYLPSNFFWILDGTLTLDENIDFDSVGYVDPSRSIDARRRTAISETPGGATNIDMSGGTYYGYDIHHGTSTIRFLNFVSVTHSTFHDFTVNEGSDDGFTLGPECNNNECRNLIGSGAHGNALTDKGDHNKWYDCIAEDCDSDGWTPKCRYSEFYRCIARRNDGPGFGMYCRIDGSGTPVDLGEAIDGNKFFACESYENDAAGFSFNISGNSGPGATIRSNYVEAVCYSNATSGVRFRNKTVDGIVADNEINLLCYGNLGTTSTTRGGLGTDAGSSYPPMTGITGSIVSFDNALWDVNTGQASDCNITVYHPDGENAPALKEGDASNSITVIGFNCLDPLVEWCMQAYCDLISP